MGFNSTVSPFQFHCFPISIRLFFHSNSTVSQSHRFPISIPLFFSFNSTVFPFQLHCLSTPISHSRAPCRPRLRGVRTYRPDTARYIVHNGAQGLHPCAPSCTIYRAVSGRYVRTPAAGGPLDRDPTGYCAENSGGRGPKLGWARPKTRVGAAKNSSGRRQRRPGGGPLGPSEASPAFPLEPPRGPPETPRDPPWAPWAPRRGAVTTFSTPAHHFCPRPRLGRLPPGAPPGAPGDSKGPPLGALGAAAGRRHHFLDPSPPLLPAASPGPPSPWSPPGGPRRLRGARRAPQASRVPAPAKGPTCGIRPPSGRAPGVCSHSPCRRR